MRKTCFAKSHVDTPIRDLLLDQQKKNQDQVDKVGRGNVKDLLFWLQATAPGVRQVSAKTRLRSTETTKKNLNFFRLSKARAV